MFRRIRQNPTATIKDFTEGLVIPDAVREFLESQGITWVDTGGGTGHWEMFGVQISGNHTPIGGTYTGLGGKPMLDPRDYAEGVGIGNDDTDAIVGTFAEAEVGQTIMIPPLPLALEAEASLPMGAILAGTGRNRWDENGTRLILAHADAKLRIPGFAQVRDLVLDGDATANWGLVTELGQRTSLSNVECVSFLQTAFVFDVAQNATVTACSVKDTPIGYAMYNGCAHIEVISSAYNCDNNAGGAAGRAILIKNDWTETRLQDDDDQIGNREITFWGGIYEAGAGDYKAEILDGFTASIRFIGTQLSQSSHPTTPLACLHVGPNYPGDVVVEGCTWATGNGGQFAKVEGGLLKYRDVKMIGSQGRNIITKTTVAGTGAIDYGPAERALIDSTFEASLYASAGLLWETWSTGTATYNSTDKCCDMTLPSTTSGVAAQVPGYQYYFAAGTIVTLRFRITDATAPVRLAAGLTASPNRKVIGVYGNGSHEVVYTAIGTESKFGFLADSATSTTAKLRYFRAEHGGTFAGSTKPSVRVSAVGNSSTPSIDTDTCDQYNITALTSNISSMTTNLTGTPRDGQRLTVAIQVSATARTIAWGASFTGNLLTQTGTASYHVQELMWSAAQSLWVGTHVYNFGAPLFQSIDVGASDTTITRSAAGRIAVEGATVGHVLSGQASLNFGSIAAQSSADLTITVTGAVVNDAVSPGPPVAPTAGLNYLWFVSAADTVTVRAINYTAGAIDPPSGIFKAVIVR